MKTLIEKLERTHTLTRAEYEALLEGRSDETAALLAEKASRIRQRVFGNGIYTRGLIEISSFCRCDCRYCGIQRSNGGASRYRLTEDEILGCCRTGYALGFRTFVLQGGEDDYFTDDRLEPLIAQIKAEHPDCAVTLSLGERSRESYRRLRAAGADRYLLRHETADKTQYALLHPPAQTFENRMRCLLDLRDLGYQTGCGFLVGAPGQTTASMAENLKFVEEFHPAMCGIGPFLPHGATPFADCPPGTLEETCYLLSILRLQSPGMLLPATTALGTAHPRGRELGILAGANVVMPNLSPQAVRKKYELYEGKICTGEEAAECRGCLERRMAAIGCTLAVDRGDTKIDGEDTI